MAFVTSGMPSGDSSSDYREGLAGASPDRGKETNEGVKIGRRSRRPGSNPRVGLKGCYASLITAATT